MPSAPVKSSLTAAGFFFFYPYGDNRHLHSFPTRRSSDLVPASPRASARPDAAGRPAPAPRGVGGERPRSGEDRKSTRLNSSHTVISYADFCLKKNRELNRKTYHKQKADLSLRKQIKCRIN